MNSNAPSIRSMDHNNNDHSRKVSETFSTTMDIEPIQKSQKNTPPKQATSNNNSNMNVEQEEQTYFRKNRFAFPVKAPKLKTNNNITSSTKSNNNSANKNKSPSIIKVKVEEMEDKIEKDELPKLRKKICRKMYKIFNEEFNLDRNSSKQMTLD